MTAEDVELPLTLSGSDPDGDPLTFQIVDPPAHGSLVGTAPVLIYRPAADYNGQDEFTFATSDGRIRSEVASVKLTISEVNDPPVLGADTATLGGAGTLPPIPPRPNCARPWGGSRGAPPQARVEGAPND